MTINRKYIIRLASMVMALLLLSTSCIENDIAYPTIKMQILDLEMSGQLGAAVINTDERTVTVTLADTVNLRKVAVKKVEMTEGARSVLRPDTLLDLTNPQTVTLSLYQDYQWTIIAKQTIDRKFKVKGQVGEAEFIPKERYATVNVSKQTSLKKIELQELKLGPTGSTINMSSATPLVEWDVRGNYAVATVIVNFRDFIVMEEWTLYVFQVESTVTTTAADAWVNVAWLYAQGLDGADNGFEIKEIGAEEWQKVDASYVTHKGGSFQARVPHLKAETSYVCRAYSGSDKGNELSFTTGKAVELPGGSFDYWHKDPNKTKVWNPWAEGGTPIWDSGNDGSTTLGESNTSPSTDTWNGSGQAAQLLSKFVGVGSIGKFAAGNLFVGEFKQVDGTNGILDFGKPFTARPTKLKGYYKYTTTPINYLPAATSTDYKRFADYKDKPDTCSIYIALGDWSGPVEIRTNSNNRKLFDKNDSHVIAYAEFNSGTTVTEYKKLEMELEYRSTSRIPTYLVIVCSASKYGDFFTGGSGAVLCVDDFSFEYDY